MLLDSYIRRKRWEAQEQAAAQMTLQAQAMGGRKQPSAPTQPHPEGSRQPAPKRKLPGLMSMDDFIKSQGLM